MKKVVNNLLIILLMFICIDVSALTVENTTVTLKPGQETTVNVYGNYLDDGGFNIKSTGNVLFEYSNEYECIKGSGPECILDLNEEDGVVLIGKLTLSIDENNTYHVAKVYLDGKVITVNIDHTEEIDYNLLNKITSKFVSINLVKDKFEYDVEIDSDLTKLDLTPVAKNENATVEVSSQVISKLENNQIIIHVEDEDIKQDYIINVNIKNKSRIVSFGDIPKKEYPILGIGVILGASICIAIGLKQYKKNNKRRHYGRN